MSEPLQFAGTHRNRVAVFAGTVVLIATGLLATEHYGSRHGAAVKPIEFSRDIRPILNQYCVACHGGVRQKNGVSFIYRAEALGKGTSGRATVVPGRPEASELIARITSTDPDVRMPYHAPPLQPQQIKLLRQWIKEGAHWEDHWAFVAPTAQPLPTVRNVRWPRQAVDRFILSRLEQEGLGPTPEAGRAALLRRVSFDLTGLPPTAAELAEFLSDTSATAYERQVDRLLSSPHYGERWAALWLDLARYADSRGYEKDDDRPTWPYRDWVIDAFNRNLSYDQFVVTQLAGDLLPSPSLDDRVATTFQRLTPANDEGGTDDEEFRLVAVMDRVATTWSVLNGLTINCVQCHSHPYDPIRHVEYYKFLGFYNTSRDADLIDDAPTLPVPLNATRRSEVARIVARREQLLREVITVARALTNQSQWRPLPITTGTVNEVLALERSLHVVQLAKLNGANPDPSRLNSRNLDKFYADLIGQLNADLKRARKILPPVPLGIYEVGGAQATGTIPLRSVFELQTDALGPAITAVRIEAPAKNPAVARHTPEDGFIVDRIDAWVVAPDGSEHKLAFRYFLPDSEENLAAAIKPAGPLSQSANAPPGASGFAANSKLFQARWIVAIPEEPLALPLGSRLKMQLLHTRDIDSRPAALRRVRLYVSSDARWTAPATDRQLRAQYLELADLERRLAHIPSVPVPVMSEQTAYEQRQTLEFERGNFLNKVGPALQPDVPAIFPKLPAAAPHNRLTMAQWFFSTDQPLTARVAVNRYWEQLFGTGLVETLEDFGSAGQVPSHPELLDWLALHFQRDLHWDMKALLRELVTSATYRQSATVTPAMSTKDPHNRLLSHGPQQRLSAEMVRDQALLASGLLSPSLGGPPVKPPQPAGVWMTVYSDAKWIDATGPNRYRRAIYTYLRRSALYPSFVTFDASEHVVSLPRRIVTNTPLQALVTLNDPVYQEANQALARQMLAVDAATVTPWSAGPQVIADELLGVRLNFAAQRVLARNLTTRECTALASFYKTARKSRAPIDDLTAYTALAGVLFNLDAALTR